MSAKDDALARLRREMKEVEPARALELQRSGVPLIDVRDFEDWSQGSPPGAIRIGRGRLELRIEEAAPDLAAPVMVMCGTGTCSLFAASDLARMGYRDVRSVAGGFNRWKDAGLPVELPGGLDGQERQRYARHLLLPEVGETGQRKLLGARVLVVGAGGLGSPAALYLAAAGVGQIGLLDHDVVERSNLQRQVLHTDAQVGVPKVHSARATLKALNPQVAVEAMEMRLTRDNVESILSGYDVIVDGSDNFPTRYLVSDACVRLGLPNVHGAVFRFEGQVSVFWPAAPGGAGPCYRCLYPAPPPPELAPSCAEAGVMGILPGVIGLLQAAEVIKIVCGIGETLVGRLLYYDALSARFTELKVRPSPACPYCAPGAPFPGYIDYEQFCAERA